MLFFGFRSTTLTGTEEKPEMKTHRFFKCTAFRKPLIADASRNCNKKMRIVSYLGVVILIVSLSFYEFVLTTERGRGRSGNRGRGRGSKYTEKKMSSIPKPRPESSGKSNSAPKMQVSPQQESSAEYVDSPRHQQSRHAVTPVVLMRHPQHQQHPEQQEFDYLQQPQYSQPQYSQPQYSQPQYSQQHQYQLLSREQYHALQQHQALQDLLKCNGLSSQSNTIQKNGQPQIPNNGSGQRRGLNAPRVVPIQSSQGVISPTQTQRQASTTTPVMRKSIAESHPLFNVESATETVDTMTLKVNTETSTKSRKIEGPSTNVIGYDDLKKVRAQVPISVVQPGPVPQLRNFTTRERFLQDKDDLFDDSKENFITHPCELEEKPWLSPLYEATPLPELTRAQREVEDRFDNVLALQCQDLLVTEEEKRKKYIALTNIMNWLENYYSSFLLSYCPDKMVPPVKVLPYGSMRLGVELKGIDC